MKHGGSGEGSGKRSGEGSGEGKWGNDVIIVRGLPEESQSYLYLRELSVPDVGGVGHQI